MTAATSANAKTQQVSARVQAGQKEERKEKDREKRAADETKPNPQRVEEYITGNYIEESYISSQDLHDGYKNWMDRTYPEE